jgi:hypothetical protein
LIHPILINTVLSFIVVVAVAVAFVKHHVYYMHHPLKLNSNLVVAVVKQLRVGRNNRRPKSLKCLYKAKVQLE